jgi:glycosyltransferase involved in cell wall biosynthesis
MKIAYVAQPFDGVVPPYQNSIGLIIYNTALRMADKASVTIYTAHRGETERVTRRDGLEIRYVSTDLDNRLLPKMQRIPGLIDKSQAFASRLYYIVYILKIARDARRRGFDVIHLLNFSQFAPIIKRLNPGTKVVLEMQCEWLEQLERSTISRRLGSVDLISGVSDHISNGYRAAFPHSKVPCVTAYNGVDPSLFRTEQEPDPDAPLTRTVLFAGRVSPEKGVHVLVDAMAAVARQVPDAQLRVVGSRSQLPLEFIVGLANDEDLRQLAVFYDGTLATDYQEYLDRRVAELGLGDRVKFLGGMPQAEMMGHFRQARLLANPSFSESFGMTVVEAMAVKLPVVATSVGGMKETVLNGETGLLVPKANAPELANALIRLLNDDRLCRDMGAKGYARALESFSWERRAENLWNSYQRLAANN